MQLTRIFEERKANQIVFLRNIKFLLFEHKINYWREPYKILRYRNHSTWMWNRNNKSTMSLKSFQCIDLHEFQPDINSLNAITGELHSDKRIAKDFNFEVKRITKKFLSVAFSRNFIRNTIKYFNKCKDDYIIPEWLFEEPKLIILRLPFSESNEKFRKSLIKKLLTVTNNKCKFNIVWNTRNIRSLFQIIDNVKHYSCVVYEGNCSCGENCRRIREKCCFKMGWTWRPK